jgi:hypothetical protein
VGSRPPLTGQREYKTRAAPPILSTYAGCAREVYAAVFSGVNALNGHFGRFLKANCLPKALFTGCAAKNAV